MIRRSADVTVVGLGPTGETVANLLRDFGCSVVAIDRDVDVAAEPRAGSADRTVVDIWEHLLGREQLHEYLSFGVPIRFLGMDGRPVLEIDPTDSNTGRPNVVFHYQPGVSRLLRNRLAEAGATVLTGVPVKTVMQGNESVSCVLGDGSTVESRFLLACDGAGSTVRSELGIAVRTIRGRSTRNTWQVLDLVPREADVVTREFRFVCDPDMPRVETVLARGRYRVEWSGPPGLESEVLSNLGLESAKVERRATYRHGAAMARSWQLGSVLLLGDAAHVMPPFGGQGMAQGVRDALSSAWRVALAVRSGGECARGYESERRPEVVRVTQLSGLAGAIVEMRSPLLARMRDLMLRRVVLPLVGRLIRSHRLFHPRSVRAGFVSARFRRGAGLRIESLPMKWCSNDPRFVAVEIGASADIPETSVLRSISSSQLESAIRQTTGARSGMFIVRPDGVIFSGGEASDRSAMIEDLQLRLA